MVNLHVLYQGLPYQVFHLGVKLPHLNVLHILPHFVYGFINQLNLNFSFFIMSTSFFLLYHCFFNLKRLIQTVIWTWFHFCPVWLEHAWSAKTVCGNSAPILPSNAWHLMRKNIWSKFALLLDFWIFCRA